MEWPKWTKANEKDLAQYATDQALELFKIDDNIYDLVREKENEKLVKAIYENLVKKNIQYSQEKYEVSEAYQRIRTPVEILTQPCQGTCLDLALLFCGLCLGCELLPKLIILESHALVAIPLNLNRRDWGSNKGFQKRFLGKRVTDSQGNERIEPEVFRGIESLKEKIEDGDYCIVECTGFAHGKSLQQSSVIESAGVQRNQDGTFDFGDAKKAGFQQLERLPFKYALDIAVAHHVWGIEPLEIPNISTISKDDFIVSADIEFDSAQNSNITGSEIGEVASGGEVNAKIRGRQVNQSKIVGNKIKKIGHSKKKTTHEVAGVKTSTSTSTKPKVAAISFKEDIEKLTEGFTGRQWLFKEIDKWLTKRKERFFILTGEPGVGKSAIAAELIQRRRDKNDIAAHHFCITGRIRTTEPNDVLRSLAAQLMTYFPDYGDALVKATIPFDLSVNVQINIETIKESSVLGVVIQKLYTKNTQEALNIVLCQSLSYLSEPPKQPVLILIDSLDEAVTYNKGEETLVTLLSQVNDLPSWVRFICTTRPEGRVLKHLENPNSYIYPLKETSEKSLKDIHDYVRKRVKTKKIQGELQKFGVKPENLLKRLTATDNGNFLYTKLLLNDIKAGSNILEKLDDLPKDLYGLYKTFLLRIDPGWTTKYRRILGTLTVTQAPVTEKHLANFTNTQQIDIRDSLDVLIQFLDVFKEGEEENETYTLFHKSFRDYLLDEKRNKSFWCNYEECHQNITKYYRANTKEVDWNKVNNKDDKCYALLYLPKHLHSSEQKEELYTLLTGSPKWMEAKSNTFGDAGYVDDLELAIEDFNDPLEEPTQILTLVKLYTARQVVNQRVSIFNLETLVWLGRKTEALSHARLSNDAKSKFYALLTIYDVLQEKKELNPALLDEAEEVAEEIRDNSDKAEALIELAATLVQSGRSDKAKDLFHKAEEVAEEIPNDYSKAMTLIDLAEALAQAMDSTKVEKVAAAAKEAISVSTIMSYQNKAKVLGKLAEVLEKVGYRTKAQDLFNEAQNVAGKEEDSWRQADALIELAIALARAGSNDTNSVFQKAEQVVDAIPESFERVEKLIELAVALAQTERKNEAKRVLDNVISIIDRDKQDQYIDVQSDLAVALAQAENFSTARTVADAIQDKRERVKVLSELAALAYSKDDNEARDIFSNAEEIANTIQEDRHKLSALDKLAEALEKVKDFTETKRIATQAKKLARAIKEGWRKPEVLSKLAIALARAGCDENKVNAVFEEAKKVASNLEKDLDRAMALSKLAVALVQSEQEAEIILTELYKIIHKILAPEKKTLNFHEEINHKAQVTTVLIQLTVDLAQANKFFEAEKIANAIQYDRFRIEAMSKLAAELAQAQKFSEAKKLVQAIEDKPAKAWAMSKLAAELAQARTGDKEADATFSEAEEVALSIEEDNDKKPETLLELSAALALAKKFAKAREIADFIELDWVKARALSKLATAYALVKKFNEAENIANEAKTLASPVSKENLIDQMSTMSELAITLAHIKFFKKAFSILGLQETPSDFLAALIEWQPSFEQIKPGLSAELLQESVYIFAWEHPDWSKLV